MARRGPTGGRERGRTKRVGPDLPQLQGVSRVGTSVGARVRGGDGGCASPHGQRSRRLHPRVEARVRVGVRVGVGLRDDS